MVLSRNRWLRRDLGGPRPRRLSIDPVLDPWCRIGTGRGDIHRLQQFFRRNGAPFGHHRRAKQYVARAFAVGFEHALFDIKEPLIPRGDAGPGFVFLKRQDSAAVTDRCSGNSKAPPLLL